MSVAFHRGQVLTANDLRIIIRDNVGTPVDPYYIRYSIFDVTTGIEVLIGPPDRIPATSGTGQFYADATVPLDANIGDWLIRWHFRQDVLSPMIEVIQEFAVVGDAESISISNGDDHISTMITRVRVLLRDNNPDRNYRFRPPASEKFLQAQAQVFGYIWLDEEIYEYLLMAVDDFNSAPPSTGINLDNVPDRWRTLIVLRACAFACFAMVANWIADEFDYSISGVSLSIDKSSKYESLKNNYIQEYDKARDLAKRSIKIVKGLRQPRYGVGISSSLGPYSRPGTQSRRNFISGFGGGWS